MHSYARHLVSLYSFPLVHYNLGCESRGSSNNALLRKVAFQVNDHRPFSPKGRSLLKITLPIHLQTFSSIEALFCSY